MTPSPPPAAPIHRQTCAICGGRGKIGGVHATMDRCHHCGGSGDEPPATDWHAEGCPLYEIAEHDCAYDVLACTCAERFA
jgi:hypothetical protein